MPGWIIYLQNYISIRSNGKRYSDGILELSLTATLSSYKDITTFSDLFGSLSLFKRNGL